MLCEFVGGEKQRLLTFTYRHCCLLSVLSRLFSSAAAAGHVRAQYELAVGTYQTTAFACSLGRCYLTSTLWQCAAVLYFVCYCSNYCSNSRMQPSRSNLPLW